MGNQANPFLTDVPSSFAAIDVDGVTVTLTGGPNYGVTSESHLQGAAVYKDVYIFTQNRHNETEGKLYFFDRSSNTIIGDMHLPVPGNNGSDYDNCYNHPGGIQVIGDYLLIAIQTQNYKNAIVQLYDLTGLSSSNPAIKLVNGDYLCSKAGDRYNGPFAGVGISKLGSNFILAVFDKTTVFFFESTESDLTDTYWYKLSTSSMNDDASEVCLLTDSAGNLYALALCVDQHGQSYADWAYLYPYNWGTHQLDQVAATHFDTQSSSGTMVGPHFRFGAGIWFPSSKTLGLLATQRLMQPSCKIDLWQPPS